MKQLTIFFELKKKLDFSAFSSLIEILCIPYVLLYKKYYISFYETWHYEEQFYYFRPNQFFNVFYLMTFFYYFFMLMLKMHIGRTLALVER